jgi:hypothetical protein
MLDKGASEVQLSDKEVIYITHNNKTEIASWFIYCDGSLGYIEAPLQEGYYVVLHENGHVDTWN